MKKWWLHTISCVCNGAAATIVLILMIYKIFTSNDSSAGNVLGILIFSLGYAIYIFSDIWGLKLYNSFKKFDSISFTDKRKVQVLLFFLVLIQIFTGSISYDLARKYIFYFQFTYHYTDSYWVIKNLILITFLTSNIVFVGCILLINTIKKNKNIKEEIETIGNNTSMNI